MSNLRTRLKNYWLMPLCLIALLLGEGPSDVQATHPVTGLIPSNSGYAIVNFTAGSLIIPMDECHQYAGETADPASRLSPICECPGSTADDGVLKAYGLVYRLAQHGIAVHVIIDDAKSKVYSKDFTVSNPNDPVLLYNNATGTTSSFFNTGCAPTDGGGNINIDYGGAPFVIAQADAPAAMALITGGGPDLGGGRGIFSASTFANVDVHVAQVDFGAKVARSLVGQPPPLALLSLGGAGKGGGVLGNYLTNAGLNDAGAGGTACAPGDIYGVFDSPANFTPATDCLDVGNYQTLWSPHWDADGTDPTIAGVITRISTFVDEGHAVFAECAAIGTLEGAFDAGKGGAPPPGGTCSSLDGTMVGGNLGGGGHFHSSNGFQTDGLGGYGSAGNEGFTFRELGSPLVQKGDLEFLGIGGTVHNWRPAGQPTCSPPSNTNGGTAGDSVALPGYLNYISSCYGADYDSTTDTCNVAPGAGIPSYAENTSAWDFYSMRRKDNDPAKGPVVYLGGHDYSGSAAGSRLVLNTLLFLPAEVAQPNPPVPTQLSRSSPIVTDVGPNPDETYTLGTFTGWVPAPAVTTYNGTADDATFEFPHTIGHLYSFLTSNILATSTAFASGAPLWDAASVLPTADPTGCASPFDGSCRTIITSTATGVRPPLVYFDQTNTGLLKSLLSPSLTNTETDTLISRVLKGRLPSGGVAGDPLVPTLGGIDRSTLAMIANSDFVRTIDGNPRETIAYAGGLDGMLHAFCATTTESPQGYCSTLGQELWAYIPRTQLSTLRFNTQRVDGPPQVQDFFGDFDGDGTSEYRTILVGQTASGNPAISDERPSAYALDITDPNQPVILWERQHYGSQNADNQGTGLGISMGVTLIGGIQKPAVFITTNQGGTNQSGIYVNAVSAVDGTDLWTGGEFFVQHGPARVPASNPRVPKSGIPGGSSVIDTDNDGLMDIIITPTLYGEIYVIDATTGANVYPGPLFSFTQDLMPLGSTPAIYRDAAGSFYAVVASGGYADPNGATWTSSAISQMVVSVKVDVDPTLTPLDETSGGPEVPIALALPPGQSAQSSVTVVGSELFVVTNDKDINDISNQIGATGSGFLQQISLVSGTLTNSYALGSGGGASIDYKNGRVYAAGSEGALALNITPGAALGDPVTSQTIRANRLIWLAQ